MASNFSQIGINYEVFSNTSSLKFNFTNKTAEEFINYIPENANTITNDYYGIVILIIIAIYLLWEFSDISEFGMYRYSIPRALGIAMGIVSTLGIILISIDYMVDFIHLSSLLTLYLIMLIYTIIYNPS